MVGDAKKSRRELDRLRETITASFLISLDNFESFQKSTCFR